MFRAHGEKQAVPHAQHWGLRLCFASAWLQCCHHQLGAGPRPGNFWDYCDVTHAVLQTQDLTSTVLPMLSGFAAPSSLACYLYPREKSIGVLLVPQREVANAKCVCCC